MSWWHCQMKDFFLPHSNVPCQFIFCFICSVAWGSVTSNQPAVIHSHDNKWRHYHFYSGPSLKRREDEVFFFLSGGGITYDPFMSRWEPLKIIICHSRSTRTAEKAPSVINLMGFAYFASPARKQAGENHTLRHSEVWGSHEGGCVFPPQLACDWKREDIKAGASWREDLFYQSCVWKNSKSRFLIKSCVVMCLFDLFFGLFSVLDLTFFSFFPTRSFLPHCFIAAF